MSKVIVLLNIMKNLIKKMLNLKFKNIFARAYALNWSEEIFVVKK